VSWFQRQQKLGLSCGCARWLSPQQQQLNKPKGFKDQADARKRIA
jgi:hypothetical protein